MKKFVEKMKRFWSLDAKTSGGFTLVELIVVIAILAILAGIAVPAYSGYVEKAKKAEDEQLLAAVNTAFAAACIENGTDVHSVDNAAIELNTDKSIKAVTVPAGYDEAFQVFYAGNADKKFEVFDGIVFDALKHAFVDIASEMITLSYGGGYITVSGEDAKKLGDSAFTNAASLGGVGGLLGKVDSVVGFGMGMLTDASGNTTAFGELILGEVYQTHLADVLGVSIEDLGSKIEAMAEQSIAGNSYATEEEREEALANARMKIMTNNAVLYAAQNTTDKDELLTILRSDDPKQSIIDAMGGDTGYGLAQASAAYGMYTAYVYSLPDDYNQDGKTKQDLIDATNDPLEILNGLKDEKFLEYMETDEAEKDLDGYLAAMNMINSSAEDPNAVSSVLINGFADEELVKLLQQATGK